MIACLRLFTALCLAALLAACSSSPSSSLGELPRTPDASLEQLLQEASASKAPEKAALLRLSATDLAIRQHNNQRAAQILAQVPLDKLKPAQQRLRWPSLDIFSNLPGPSAGHALGPYLVLLQVGFT